MKKIIFIFCGIVLLSSFVACFSKERSSDIPAEMTSNEIQLPKFESLQVQKSYLTFEDAILLSNTAIVGEYIETIEHEFYIEKKFKVKECLYGNVKDEEIYLFFNRGTGYVEGIDYEYELGTDIYKEGMEYLLVMEKRESIFYDHDRYLLTSDMFLCENTNTYTMYSQKIEIPAETTIKEYVCTIYSSVSHPVVINAPVSYENEIDEMVDESWYVGTVKILELVKEGRSRNSNSYRCKVESLSKGENLNTYEDGTFYMAILKDTVEVGSRYIIGFSPVADENSLIYVQTTAGGVFHVSEDILDEISQAISLDK